MLPMLFAEGEHDVPRARGILQVNTRTFRSGAEKVCRDGILNEKLRAFEESLPRGAAIAPADMPGVCGTGVFALAFFSVEDFTTAFSELFAKEVFHHHARPDVVRGHAGLHSDERLGQAVMKETWQRYGKEIGDDATFVGVLAKKLRRMV